MKIGFAFPEHIRTERILRHKHREPKHRSMRGYVIVALAVFGIGMLFIRLFFLQVVQGSYYRELSDSNRIRTKIVHAPRGIINDRNGVPLVFNIPGFRKLAGDTVVFMPRERALTLLAEGQDLEIDSLRSYPFGEATSHVLGYVGQITSSELKQKPFINYSINNVIGKTGIESEYEHLLSGVDGKQLNEVDAAGRFIRTLGQTAPVPGKDIALTLDINLQEKVFEAMKGVVKGAVVVSTPTGDILAMISKPSFDSNLFTLGKPHDKNGSTYQTAQEVLTDSSNQPLINRVISGTYPPGSTFKLVVASAGLDSKLIDERYTVLDTGVVTVGKFSFSNWYFTMRGKTDGELNVVKAIARSNDIFFYKLAEKIGVDNISDMASQFGLGKRLGIDLGGEESGIVPTRLWKKEKIGEDWYLGDTYHYGIGQGYVLTTPLQVNMWTGVIANGGMLYQPHLLKSNKQKVISNKFLSEKTLSLIREGMVESCQPQGVGWPLFEFKVKNAKLKIDGKNFLEAPQSTTSADFKDYRQVSIGCKTGTAEHGGDKALPHAWITLFAPAYDPQIVVTVLAESSGEGSNVAAPISKKILGYWFTK
ncbi:MAG: hypothetical protein HYT11_04575 [Candidatus Levybacteria bacterium]|nr:hypothetical protein [Candidatus Levybacteria bacterium]